MISISSELTAAIAANVRYPKLKVDVLLNDPNVGSLNTVETTDVNNMGDLSSTVVNALNLHICDTVTSTPHKYFILDGTAILDDDFYLSPGTVQEATDNQLGWYSESVSDGSGDFATAPSATVDFGEDRSVQQINVVGEPTILQYPVDYIVRIYDSGDVLLHTVTTTGNDQITGILDVSAEEITDARYMTIEISKWSHADTVSKIVEFFGVIAYTVYQDDISSLDILEEAEADGGASPFGNKSCNEMMLEFQNISITGPDGNEYDDPYIPDNTASFAHNSITTNVRLTPSIGFVLPDTTTEWVPMGVFWSTDWDVSEFSFNASVTARDRMDILRRNDFLADEVLESATLYEVAEYVLNHAKVNIPLNDLDWELSSYLSYITVPYVWLGRVTYMEALVKIADACQGRVYVNRYDKVVIEAFNADAVVGSADVTITKDDFFSHNMPISPSGIKNYIVVPVSPLVPEETAGDVYTTDDITVGAGDTTIVETVEWGDDVVLEGDAEIVESVGVTMSKPTGTFYPHSAVLTTTKLSGTSGTFKIKITGKKLLSSAITDVTDFDQDSIDKYQKSTHTVRQNHLVQSGAVAQVIATAQLNSLSDPRKDCIVEIPGNPAIEVGDIADIDVYSKNSVTDEFRIVRQQFKYEDGFNVTITARKTIDFGS